MCVLVNGDSDKLTPYFSLKNLLNVQNREKKEIAI